MDEILGSVSMLAQDQYGNYVVQVCNIFQNTYTDKKKKNSRRLMVLILTSFCYYWLAET